MYARSTTISAEPGRIDDGIAVVNELLPTMSGIDGCMGLSLLVDRSSNRCIATSSWESEIAMRGSREQVQPLRQRLLDALGSEASAVQEWEIALLHRNHESPEGAAARVTWARPREGELDAAVDSFRSIVMPILEAQEGFCGLSMFVDREAGLTCATASFDRMGILEETREVAAQRRAEMTERTGIEFLDVIECELAVHHLRVPELV